MIFSLETLDCLRLLAYNAINCSYLKGPAALVTSNTEYFKRISGLKTEDWK